MTNPNEPQKILNNSNKKIKTTSLENCFLSQVVLIWCKVNREEVNKSSKKNQSYSFEGKLARSQHWFALYIECIETNFKTRDPDFHKANFQHHISDQTGSEVPILPVPIGNLIEMGQTEFHSYVPTLEYLHKNSKSCCFNSFASESFSSGENIALEAISGSIK